MTDFLDDIVASAPEMQRLVAEEAFILDAIEEIYAAMEQAGVSKTDLARELNTSLANVSQKLRGTSNLTLRTVAAIAHAMNLRPVLRLEDSRVASGWGQVYGRPAYGAMARAYPCNDATYHTMSDGVLTYEELSA